LSVNGREAQHRHGIAYVHVDWARDGGARRVTQELSAAVIIDNMKSDVDKADAIDAFGKYLWGPRVNRRCAASIRYSAWSTYGAPVTAYTTSICSQHRLLT
jgi:hypothetical protein